MTDYLATITIKITPNEKGNPPGKLADAELHFTDGPLAGLKLIGFSVWKRTSGSGRNITFPGRQYSVNGERRSFALLRPISDTTNQDRIREMILHAYARHEASSQMAGDRNTWSYDQDGLPLTEATGRAATSDERTPDTASRSTKTSDTASTLTWPRP